MNPTAPIVTLGRIMSGIIGAIWTTAHALGTGGAIALLVGTATIGVIAAGFAHAIETPPIRIAGSIAATLAGAACAILAAALIDQATGGILTTFVTHLA